ncbi:hypothetical protein ACIU1J_15340 [Azospirillum doebereinerae]|uniref:hypothetical protein n=1 Tax=Azospirillum doebereinerae TaxID=92933 RepID=UPI001EE5CF83|nr:hypothetical protein [Azospirillum doebereinerae]MCG5242677.1 hypothetical protein [Azospirillum doebereinerae]
MTSIPTTSPSLPVNRYALEGGSVQRPSPASVKSLKETGNSAFTEDMKRVLAGTMDAPDAAGLAQSRAVQAHTIVRENGQVVATIWRDGQTSFTNSLNSKLDWSTMDKRTGGMTSEQRRSYIAGEIMKNVGATARIERYGENGPSPTQGAVFDEIAKENLKPRGVR